MQTQTYRIGATVNDAEHRTVAALAKRKGTSIAQVLRDGIKALIAAEATTPLDKRPRA